MKLRIFVSIFVLTIAGNALAADQSVTQTLGVVDEKLTRLSAQVEALEFKQTKLEQDIQKLQADVAELRRTGGGASQGECRLRTHGVARPVCALRE